MARKRKTEYRDNIIDMISNTDNFKVIQDIISFRMSTTSLNIDLEYSDLYNMLEVCCVEISKLMGDSVSEFRPYRSMKALRPKNYFSIILKGLEDIRTVEEAIEANSDLLREFSEYSESYLDRGNFRKVAELRQEESNIVDINELIDSYKKKNLRADVDVIDEISSGNSVFSGSSKLQFKVYKKSSGKNLTKKEINLDNILFYEEIQYAIRKYLYEILDVSNGEKQFVLENSHIRFLCNYDGELILDYPHMYLLYQYLKTIKFSKLNKIKAVLYYFGMQEAYIELSDCIKNGKDGRIDIRPTPSEMEKSANIKGYKSRYFPMISIPKGFRGYIFEPINLAQVSFLSGINHDDLYIESMGENFNAANELMRHRNNGLFYKFLDKDTENYLMPMIVSGDCYFEDLRNSNPFVDAFLHEYELRRVTFEKQKQVKSMLNIFDRIVKPFSVEVLGSYLRKYFSSILKNTKKDNIFIYYVSSQRVGIAVSDRVSDEYILNELGSEIYSRLKKCEIPTIQEMIEENLF